MADGIDVSARLSGQCESHSVATNDPAGTRAGAVTEGIHVHGKLAVHDHEFAFCWLSFVVVRVEVCFCHLCSIGVEKFRHRLVPFSANQGKLTFVKRRCLDERHTVGMEKPTKLVGHGAALNFSAEVDLG